VGAVLTGSGRFAGLDGVYTYCGDLDQSVGFKGSVVLRLVDPHSHINGRWSMPELEAVPYPDEEFSYISFRAWKPDPSYETTLIHAADGTPTGLHLLPQLKAYTVECGMTSRGPTAEVSLGQLIGSMATDIHFNPLNPGAPGTTMAPIPFSAVDLYRFMAEDGTVLGSIEGATTEGRVFVMPLSAPNQQAVRFGGFGPLQEGTGALAGAVGILAHNSAVGISPHVLSTLHVCRIYDPAGKYRAS
jgi:hypothetical protein